MKYYILPINTNIIKYENDTLDKILEIVNVELYERGKQELNIVYEVINDGFKIEVVQKHLKDLFKEYKIPNSILIEKNDNGLKELKTGLPLTLVDHKNLEIFRVSNLEIIDFFVKNKNYGEEICNFFEHFIRDEKNVKNKNLF